MGFIRGQHVMVEPEALGSQMPAVVAQDEAGGEVLVEYHTENGNVREMAVPVSRVLPRVRGQVPVTYKGVRNA